MMRFMVLMTVLSITMVCEVAGPYLVYGLWPHNWPAFFLFNCGTAILATFASVVYEKEFYNVPK